MSIKLILLLANWANAFEFCDATRQVATKRKRRKVLCYEKRTRWNGCVGDADVNLDCLVVVAPFAEITITDATFRFAIDVHAAAAV